MKRRASLALMEQLIMVLVFALAAALCLLVFAKAQTLADNTTRRDEAVLIARNTAELLKSGTDPDTLPIPDPYTVVIASQNDLVPGLAQAEITVSHAGECLFSLTVGWQEAIP